MDSHSPMTFQQRWLWDLVRRHRGWNCSVAYAFCLKGDLSVPLLARSLAGVMDRHSALRAEIVPVNASAQLQVAANSTPPLDVTPVTEHAGIQIEEQAQRIFAQFADRVVDPVVGPLLSVRLLRLTDHEHWLLVAIHRLMADCFSADQMFRELWWLYRGDSPARPADIPADPPQYGDYALWQHKTDAAWSVKHGPYWQDRLAGASSLRWPPDVPEAGGAHGVNGRMRRWLGDVVSRRVQELARQTRSLAAMVMFSIYVAVLWRWCRQTDFVLPFYVAGRQTEHKYVVGYFSHLLYLRVELTGEESFGDLLRRSSNEFFRAVSHQDYGRMSLQRPDLLSGALFQWVTWHPQATVEMRLAQQSGELQVERLPLKDFAEGLSALPPGLVDVDITFFDTHEGLYAQGVYRADRFSPTTIERFMDDLCATAERLVRDPNPIELSLSALAGVPVVTLRP